MLKETISYHLFYRFHDKQWNTWRDWEEITGRQLLSKYGDTQEDWIKNCQAWIDVGGRYEYKIVCRTEIPEWGMTFDTELSRKS